MKRRIKEILCLLCIAAVLGGCGNDTAVLSELKTKKYVTLGNYQGLEVSVASPKVTEDYQQNYIGYILSSNAEWVEPETERAVQSGDLVNIDYLGKVDGVAFEGGTAQGYDLEIGSHSFIDGFEDGLIGAKKGETREVETVFPDPYKGNPDLSGAEAIFTVTVNEIKEKHTPELTDAFVQTLDAGCDTVAEYEAYVYELLMKDAQRTYETHLEEALIDKAMENCSFQEPPKAMVDQYYDRVVRNLSQFAAANGVSLETLITGSYGTTMEEFEEQAREGAVLSCKESIMLQAIANKEGITVSQEEVDASMEEAVKSGAYSSLEELKTALGNDDYRDYVMCDKVLALMKESAVITEP